MQNNIVEFKAKIEKLRFKADDSDFKIYIAIVDKSKYKNINANNKGDFIITGNLHELVPNVEYSIRALETSSKFGYQYKVLNIRRDKPISPEASKSFLKEIVTDLQAETLLSIYPNIIDKVMQNDLSDIDLTKTKGIKEKTFLKIKDRIIENFALVEIIDKLGGTLNFAHIKKLYDKYPSIEVIEKELKKDPYKCLCGLSRVGFKTADKLLLDIEANNKNKEILKFDYKLKTSRQRMLASIIYLLEKNETDGNTVMKIQNLTKECSNLTPECINHFLSIIREEDDLLYIDDKRKLIAFKKTYETEKYIAEKLNQMLKGSIKWAVNPEAYRLNNNGINLTDEQVNTINLLASNDIVILTAPGGAGKTESVKSVLNMLDERMLTYTLMTPTGKSAEVLSDYTKLDAGTIHRKLDFNPSREGNPFGFNNTNKLTDTVIVVDEFSMVDIFLFKHLLEAIETGNTKLLLVFDAYQLASVGCGNLAHDLLQSKKIPTNFLTKIFRYGEGGLMNVATKIRNSDEFIDKLFKGVKVYGQKKDFVFAQRSDINIIPEVVKLYKGLLNKNYSSDDIMVLSAQNKGKYGVESINKSIQELIQANKNNDYITRGETLFYKGDKVIQMVNAYRVKDIHDKEVNLYNGNTGIIRKVYKDSIVVNFDNKIVELHKSELKNIELGYCYTIHRSQGSAAKQVIVAVPNAHTFNMNSNLLYVAATRAKERCYFIGNPLTVCRAIKKKENFKRNTMIKYLL